MECPLWGKGKIWCKSSWVYSWSSLLSEAPTKDKQFYIGMVWDTLQGPETIDSFFKVIAWSFKFLQQGIWPTEDYQGNKQLAKHCWFVVFLHFDFHILAQYFFFQPRYPRGSLAHQKAGRPLANGWSAILFALQGDMDYLSNVLKLPSWQKKQQCCCLCQADTVGENSWRDFSENAPWVATCWTPQTWHLFPQKSPCKLLNDIPGASAALVALDFMHNKYLGTDQYVFGSVMQLVFLHFLFFALSFLHFLFCTLFFALSMFYFCTFPGTFSPTNCWTLAALWKIWSIWTSSSNSFM